MKYNFSKITKELFFLAKCLTMTQLLHRQGNSETRYSWVARTRGSTFTLWHDDVIKWKYFPRYWPFVRGIHQSLVESPFTKGSGAELWCFRWSALEKRLSKQSRYRWLEKPSRSFWRHCNVPSKFDLYATLLAITRNMVWYQHCTTPHHVIKLMNSSMPQLPHRCLNYNGR